MSPDQSETAKNPSAIKPICQFNDVLDIKQKTDVCRLGAVKSKLKAVRSVNELWSRIPKRCGH